MLRLDRISDADGHHCCLKLESGYAELSDGGDSHLRHHEAAVHGAVFKLEPQVRHDTEGGLRGVTEHVQLAVYDRPVVGAITAAHSYAVHATQFPLPAVPLSEQLRVLDGFIPVPSAQPDLLNDALGPDDEWCQHAKWVEHRRCSAQYSTLRNSAVQLLDLEPELVVLSTPVDAKCFHPLSLVIQVQVTCFITPVFRRDVLQHGV